jgi:hypothetical protein
MATLDAAPYSDGYILPRPAGSRRNLTRRRPAATPLVPRGSAARRRTARPETGRLSGERIDTLLLQGGIVLAMAGMLLYFHAPLLDAVRSLV